MQPGNESDVPTHRDDDPGNETTVNLPWVESPFFEQELVRRRSELTDEEQNQARHLHEQGYLVLEQAVPHDLCDRIPQQVDPLFTEGYTTTERRVPDAWLQGADAVRELAALPSIQRTLQRLYGRRPIPFQTLTFKWGTQQPDHTDQIHFSCIPARFMCGVWVACEDTDEDNGPLFYYPGSQRLPELNGYDIGGTVDEQFYPRYEKVLHRLMTELGYKAVEFHARKGDALVWASNLVHGGRPVRREGSTRWSQVTHYMFENCIYYQPHASEIPTGEFRMLDIVDLNTLQPVPSNYNGRPISVLPAGNSRARLWIGEPTLVPSQPRRVEPAVQGPSVEVPAAARTPTSSFAREFARLVAQHVDRRPLGHRFAQAVVLRRRRFSEGRRHHEKSDG
jgi:hypothetical protein